MPASLSAHAVFQALLTPLNLSWIGGTTGGQRVLWPPPEGGAPFFGRLNWTQPPRLQLLGAEEIQLLERIAPAVREVLLSVLLEPAAGAFLVCGGVRQAEALRALADAVIDVNIPRSRM